MLADFGWSDRAAEAGIQAEVIQHLGEIDLWSKAGNRVTLNRFLQAVRVSAHEDKVWSARLHSQLYCCIQEDMLHGEAFRKHYERVPITVASGGEGKATMKELNEELRAVKASCKNLLVLSTLFLQEVDNQIRQRIIVAASAPYERWHTKQNKTLRAASDTLPWVIAELTGGFWAVMQECHSQLANAEVLVRIFADPASVSDAATMDINDPRLMREQEFAKLLSGLVRMLSFARQCRCAWLVRGWPARSALWLHGPTSEACIREFEEDSRRYEMLKRCCAEGAPHRDLLKRSVFHLMPVQQLSLMLAKEGGLSLRLERYLRDFHRRGFADQLSEDILRECRTVEINSKSRTAPPKTCFHHLVRQRVLETRHRYHEVEPKQRLQCRGMALPPTLHKVLNEESSMDFGGVRGASAPAWYSPRADQLCVEVFDMELLRLCESNSDRFAGLEMVWMNRLFDGTGFVFRNKDSSRWLFPLGAAPQGPGLCWLAEEKVLAGGRARHFELSPTARIEYVMVQNINDFVAVPVTAVSPLMVWRLHPEARLQPQQDRMRVLFMQDQGSEEVGLLKLAATKGFWDFPLPAVKNFADHVGVSYPRGGSLFEVLHALTAHLLDEEPLAVMKVLENRLGQQSEEAELAEGLVHIDEGFELLAQDEAQEVRKAQADTKIARENRESFARHFSQKKREILSLQMPSKKRKKKGDAAQGMVRNRLPKTGDIDQSVARQFAPPGGSIWKNNRAGGWCGHYPPFARFSRLILSFGSDRAALIAALQELWRAHMTITGESDENCLVIDLFSQVPERENLFVSAASSSAASGGPSSSATT